MTGQIFIESHEVTLAGLPFGAEHLYLVFRDANGAEYVIRSGPETPYLPVLGDMKIEANVSMDDSADDRGGDSPEDRSSTPLDFPGLTDDQAWAIMVKYARMIDAANYPYELFDANSNAFIGAMLAAAGGAPDLMLPLGIDRGDAVGFSSYPDILKDVPPPKDGIVRGTEGADRIAGIQIDEVIRVQGGADTVWAGRGNDQVQGNAGNDLLHGQAGADALNGGSDKDLLDGGAGENILTGGTEADVFLFTRASTNRISDFQDGLDVLRIEGTGADSFDDLTIASFGASGQHTRIAFGHTVIEVLNVAPAHLDARDIQFA